MTTPPAKTVDLHRLLVAARLPALPQSAIKVMELSRNPENGPPELAVPIEADPGLTSQVLRFVNSSYFGFRNEISSVKHAITMVGARTIKNFVLWSAVFSLMPNPRCGPFDLKTLWQDSLRRGLFARMLAKLSGRKECEDAFAAALLQDMAVPLLAKALPADYVEMLDQRSEAHRRLSSLEQERFGWDHAQVGGMMAQQWHLPAELTAAIEGHTLPPAPAGESDADRLTALVSLSALLPSATDALWFEQAACEQAFEAWPLATPSSLHDLLEKTDQEFAELAPLLKLQAPIRTLVDYAQAAAAGTV